ncbi:MAG: hypothetical protein ACNYNY_00695 [Candidatus Oxydemutatoraceae bacterium WSBS_2016_MAG_OTU14]
MLLQDDPPDSSLSSLPGREFFAVIGFTNFTQPKDSLSPFANEQLLEDGVSSVADGFSSFSLRVLLAPPSTVNSRQEILAILLGCLGLPWRVMTATSSS